MPKFRHFSTDKKRVIFFFLATAKFLEFLAASECRTVKRKYQKKKKKKKVRNRKGKSVDHQQRVFKRSGTNCQYLDIYIVNNLV